jgi:hypothetical protein
MAYQELKQAEYLLLKKYAELQKTDQLEISFVNLSDTLILQQAHDRLDQTVALAYGIEPETEPLQFLLNLNLQVTAKEANGETITPPGLPDFVSNRADFISPDCVSMNE